MISDNAFDQLLEKIKKIKIDLQGKKNTCDANVQILLQIFDYFESDAKHLRSESFPHRIDKAKSKLPRTLNIVPDLNGELMLMLELKSKNPEGFKDPEQLIGQGVFGKVKPAVRIDVWPIQKWVNKTSMGKKHIDIALHEAQLSQIFAQDNAVDDPNINITVLGPVFEKTKNSLQLYKIAQYSKQADYDLCMFLGCLSTLEKEDATKAVQIIFKDILVAVKRLHDKNVAHQDIKLDNIFVYKVNDEYRAKLSDFGNGFEIEKTNTTPRDLKTLIHASMAYESPERVHQLIDNPNWRGIYPEDDMIHDATSRSHGYHRVLNQWGTTICLSQEMPTKASDMWAVGIVLYLLLYRKYPENQGEIFKAINAHPLLKGLLEVNPEKRFTVEQALNMFDAMVHTNCFKLPMVQPEVKKSGCKIL